MRWMMHFIVACLLTTSPGLANSGANNGCRPCHGPPGKAVHAGFPCNACHRGGGAQASDPAARSHRASGCVSCHRGYDGIFDRPMGTRKGERDFAARTFGRCDQGFFTKNCNGCHLQGCQDCHGSGHALRRPDVADCHSCHKGYFIGWDYAGRAPREDNMRYQRGSPVAGETFLKMLPDVHYRAGMTCGSCHSMGSLAGLDRKPRQCSDCHRPDRRVLEHRITAHLEKLECYACHSAWAAQEYGTFFLRFPNQRLKEDFDLKPAASADYLRSAYLRKQDAPPLGLNSRGRISPIRPQFIAYYTDIRTARNKGPENTLLGAEWRAFFPHTVQRGTVTCEGCHDNPRRFILEPQSSRIYELQKDGMSLTSFWSQEGQRVVNGSFMSAAGYRRLTPNSPAYKKAYIEKWRNFLNRVEPSAPR